MNNIELEVEFKDTEEMEIEGLYPAGPKGEKGDRGEQGIAGPKGEKGEKGDPGAQLRVLVVDKVPENEENGVLYLIRKTVENLYPNQIQMSETGNGVTVTFVDKQFSVNGTCTPNSQWGWTRTFEMPLEPNKKYNVQFTLKSGSFDNTERVENGNNDVLRVLMYGYKSVESEINLLNNTDMPKALIAEMNGKTQAKNLLAEETNEVVLISKDISSEDIYKPMEITFSEELVGFYLSIATKAGVTYNDWICDISVTEA